MTHPVRGLLHGSAAVVALVGAIILFAIAPGDGWRRITFLVFGLSLVGLFTVSSLYHSIPWREAHKQRMQRLDHVMIYVLIAGTFTPLAAIVLDGWIRVMTLTTQGWLGLLLLWPLSSRLPWTALALIGLGGLFYTVGMVLLVTNRPRLWPRTFSYHEVFHILVVAAASLHFAAISGYVLRFGI
jgi:hemolysin III